MADGITKIESQTDPDRCQGVAAHGQCNNKAIEGCNYCKIHGNSQKRQKDRNAANLYRIDRFRDRVNDLEVNKKSKSLSEEIAILRMILEEQLRQCQTNTDLLLQSQTIYTLIDKIEKVVVSCNKLDTSLGKYMDATQLMGFANKVIEIITLYIADERILNSISNDILKELGEEE